jgi:hypothetical protein
VIAPTPSRNRPLCRQWLNRPMVEPPSTARWRSNMLIAIDLCNAVAQACPNVRPLCSRGEVQKCGNAGCADAYERQQTPLNGETTIGRARQVWIAGRFHCRAIRRVKHRTASAGPGGFCQRLTKAHKLNASEAKVRCSHRRGTARHIATIETKRVLRASKVGPKRDQKMFYLGPNAEFLIHLCEKH